MSRSVRGLVHVEVCLVAWYVFMSFVFSSGYSLFCCTETWLTEAIFDNEIIACGHCIYRKDRLSRGGGVLIAVNESIPSAEIDPPMDLESGDCLFWLQE